jgi:hypothetical protein
MSEIPAKDCVEMVISDPKRDGQFRSDIYLWNC